MGIKIEKIDKHLIAYMDGDIDHHSAKDIREQIDLEIKNHLPSKLILDFKNVSFMDSSGIGLVMGRYKSMKSIDGGIQLKNLSSHISKVMKLAGIEKILKITNI
ncbi:MAG: anti-sigma factor antagonist [Oscillospiraceae bacterium]|nr:anti-sigma factor antagonist [Oscillospiraceae bacterium]